MMKLQPASYWLAPTPESNIWWRIRSATYRPYLLARKQWLKLKTQQEQQSNNNCKLMAASEQFAVKAIQMRHGSCACVSDWHAVFVFVGRCCFGLYIAECLSKADCLLLACITWCLVTLWASAALDYDGQYLSTSIDASWATYIVSFASNCINTYSSLLWTIVCGCKEWSEIWLTPVSIVIIFIVLAFAKCAQGKHITFTDNCHKLVHLYGHMLFWLHSAL